MNEHHGREQPKYRADDKKTKEHANVFSKIYDKHYKPLLIISVLLVIFSIGAISYQHITTGDFVNKGVSLTGGISLTLAAPNDPTLNPDSLQSYILAAYPKADVNVRTFGTGANLRYSVEASGISETDLVNILKPKFPNLTDVDFTHNKQTIGPTFGQAFFTQTLKAVFMAFIFMGIVIFLYFGESTRDKWITGILSVIAAYMMFYASSLIMYIIPLILFVIIIIIYIRDSIPAFGIILCAMSDILFSLAIFNLTGHKLSVASVAAFLMLIGYSIDTDILLSVRVLKRKEGNIYSRTVDALKTGLTMSICALIAVLSAYFLTNSIVIKEIMFVLSIGLVGDIIFTWIQNAGILRWHLETKGWK